MMRDKYTYRNFGFILCLIGIVLTFLEFNDEKINDLLDLLEDVLFIVAYLFILLWLKRIILFIGIMIYLVSFNIDLITNDLLPAVKPIYYVELYDLAFVLSVCGILIFLIGLSDNIKIGKLTNEVDLNTVNLIGFSFLVTLFIQTIIRL